MAIDFPNSPSSGDIHTENGKQWSWDGEKWLAYGVSLSPSILKVDTGNNRVGINQIAPTVALDVTGSARITGDLTVSGTTVTVDSASVLVKDRIQFEGATADGYETVLLATDPTADRTITLPNATGTVALASDSTSLTGSTNTWIPTITGANALTGTANFTYDGNTLDVKNSGTASSIKLYCETSNAHYQAIKAAPHSGSSNWTLTLPSTAPSVSGQALTATTSGVASWSTVSSDSVKDADNDTKIQVEEGSDEDIIRFDTAGTEQMTIKADGTITLTQGLDDVNAVLAVQIFR